MKDAWKGLKVLKGQEKSKKEYVLLNEVSPNWLKSLNSFYVRFGNKDFSHEHSRKKNELLKLTKDQEPINIQAEEVISVLNQNKCEESFKISSLMIKKCLSSLLYIVHKLFQISISAYKMLHTWTISEIIFINKKIILK